MKWDVFQRTPAKTIRFIWTMHNLNKEEAQKEADRLDNSMPGYKHLFMQKLDE